MRAEDLTTGNELPLNFSQGMVIAFKSSTLDVKMRESNIRTEESLIGRVDLDLCNINNDIILRITFLRGQNNIFFDDRAGKSLLNARGQEQSVKLSQMDVSRWKRSGVTISVHDCSTASKQQYQILFDLTTMYYFDKRFPGPAIKIIYSTRRSLYQHRNILSNPLKVFTCNLDDLPHMEKHAIKSGL